MSLSHSKIREFALLVWTISVGLTLFGTRSWACALHTTDVVTIQNAVPTTLCMTDGDHALLKLETKQERLVLIVKSRSKSKSQLADIEILSKGPTGAAEKSLAIVGLLPDQLTTPDAVQKFLIPVSQGDLNESNGKLCFELKMNSANSTVGPIDADVQLQLMPLP